MPKASNSPILIRDPKVISHFLSPGGPPHLVGRTLMERRHFSAMHGGNVVYHTRHISTGTSMKVVDSLHLVCINKHVYIHDKKVSLVKIV